MPKKRVAREVIRLGKYGVVLGVVHAASEDEAVAEAIARFDIRHPDKVRLLVRPV
jgi:hypothetical protein